MLTDTHRPSLKIIFISDLNSEIFEDKYRDLLFKVITTLEICKRFDSFHKFKARKENKIKKLRYYEIKNIDNPCVLTLVVNPKEHHELLEDKNLNKKCEGVKKASYVLGFENFSKGSNH